MNFLMQIQKIELSTIFGKVIAKNRAFGNNSIFLQQLFPFRGGVLNHQPTPAYATASRYS